MEQENGYLKDVGNLDFDLFKMNEDHEDRSTLLPVISLKIIYNCGLRQIVNDDKLVMFLAKV